MFKALIPRENLMKMPLFRFFMEIYCHILWHDHRSWIVGGWVRDLWLGRESADLDGCTTLPMTYLKQLNLPNTKVVLTGEQYGTVTFVRGDMSIEMTVCREDFGNVVSADSRKEVFPTFIHQRSAGLRKDVSRRDLTVNSLAMDPWYSFVLDLTEQAIPDLEAGVIRFMGDATQTCRDDALRAWRAVRIGAKLGFALHPSVFEATVDPVFQRRSRMLSAERVRDELLAILSVPDSGEAARAITLLQELGLLDFWLPELTAMIGVEQNTYHSYDVWGHTIRAVENSRPYLEERLFALFHDVGKVKTAEFKAPSYGYSFRGHEALSAEIFLNIGDRLRMGHHRSGKYAVDIEKVAHLIRHHMNAFVKGKPSRMIKRLGMDKWGSNMIDISWHVGRSDFLAKHPDKFDEAADKKLRAAYEFAHDLVFKEQPFSPKDLALNGSDIMHILAIPPGPKVGETIAWLMEQVLDHGVENTPEALTRCLCESVED